MFKIIPQDKEESKIPKSIEEIEYHPSCFNGKDFRIYQGRIYLK